MPTIPLGDGYVARFYSSDRFEPPHVHVLKAGCEAKVWLQPMALQHNHGYTQRELREILRLVGAGVDLLMERWNEYFSDLATEE